MPATAPQAHEPTDTHVAELRGMLTELRPMLTELRDLLGRPRGEPRESYSVEEAADLLGKQSYTVRQWCRLGRINARKRTERRGGTELWSISADELRRYQDDGLLPIDPGRNAGR